MNLNLKQLRLDFKKSRLESKTLSIRLRALIELAKRRSNIATSYSELDYFFVAEKTDNGVEFTSKFISHSDNPSKNCYEIFLADQNIKHRLIPPDEKELNGLVERSHRADDEEFYHRVRPDDLKGV